MYMYVPGAHSPYLTYMHFLTPSEFPFLLCRNGLLARQLASYSLFRVLYLPENVHNQADLHSGPHTRQCSVVGKVPQSFECNKN